MSFVHKKWRRIIAFMLACCVLCLTSMQYVSADTSASESEGIGTSMYDVSTSLTAYANSVIGSNTNDKHSDHILKEIPDAVGNDDICKPGIAGAFIGYGDEDKDFYAYISSNTAKSVTTSSYDAWLNAGDNGNIYTYARYGHLLSDLGLDETGNATGSSSMRNMFGLFMQGTHATASFIPQVFDFSLDILKTLNPFQFFANDTNVKNAITNPNDIAGSTPKDIFGDEVVDPDAHNVDNPLKANQDLTNASAGGILKPVVDFVSDIYDLSQDFGMLTIIPLLVAILLFTIIMRSGKNSGDTFGKIKTFVLRLTFIAVGVPLCGVLYTSVLNNISDVVQKSPAASKLVACTFVDFQSWVQSSRLDLPGNVQLTSSGQSSNDGDSVTAAGSANADTIRKLRNITFKINEKIYNFGFDANLGLSNNSHDYDAGTNAGIWNTNGTLKADNSNATVEKQVNAMLARYRSGDFYQASAWETAVNGAITSNHKDDLGATPSTANADSNANKVYGMYDETDECSDWLNRTIDDNKKILKGNMPASEPKYNWNKFNIFSNGALKTTGVPKKSGKLSTEVDITYKSGGATWDAGKMADPENKGGLSSISMYNYLSTSFDDSSISVYSAEKATSEYTKRAHYSVNLIGSGGLSTAYAVNCIACLFTFALIGLIYGFGMIIGNLKRGLNMIMQVPFAMMGAIRSAMQVVVYVFVMCIELIVTVFVYQFVCDLVVVFASVIETPIEDAVKDATILIGGKFAFISDFVSSDVLYDNRMILMTGIFVMAIAVSFMTYKVVKHRRAILSCMEYAICKYYRAVTFSEMLPVFDAWMANRKSLYVWDSVSDVGNAISETVIDVVTTSDNDMQKGVQTV